MLPNLKLTVLCNWYYLSRFADLMMHFLHFVSTNVTDEDFKGFIAKVKQDVDIL